MALRRGQTELRTVDSSRPRSSGTVTLTSEGSAWRAAEYGAAPRGRGRCPRSRAPRARPSRGRARTAPRSPPFPHRGTRRRTPPHRRQRLERVSVDELRPLGEAGLLDVRPPGLALGGSDSSETTVPPRMRAADASQMASSPASPRSRASPPPPEAPRREQEPAGGRRHLAGAQLARDAGCTLCGVFLLEAREHHAHASSSTTEPRPRSGRSPRARSTFPRARRRAATAARPCGCRSSSRAEDR